MKGPIIILSIIVCITSGCTHCDIAGTWQKVSDKDASNASIKLVFSKDSSFHYYVNNAEITKTMNDAGDQYESKSYYKILSTDGDVRKGVIYSNRDSTKQYFNFKFIDCNKMKIETPFDKEGSEFARIP